MRRNIILIIALFTLIVLSLGYGIHSKMKHAELVKNGIKKLPAFSFKTMEGNIFRSSSIEKGPVIITYYHPECEHCQYQVTALLDSLKIINARNLLFISNANRDSILSFWSKLKVSDNRRVILLIDDSLKFGEYFGTTSVPSTFIYGIKFDLLKYYIGEIKPGAVIKVLE